ncbi:hypothetical protein [Microbulbifer mangrovi]|uniref:hypothetical protein n=1 Tax=Microbulbifer mangrovi TaxID=927787 RepID=UPI0011804E0E|nr:hypothetical protein [Microbulbifer mangrovi]
MIIGPQPYESSTAGETTTVSITPTQPRPPATGEVGRPAQVTDPTDTDLANYQTGFGYALVPSTDISTPDVTSGLYIFDSPYSLEFLEPQLDDHVVEVHRGKKTYYQRYSETTEAELGALNLIVIGIRNPDYRQANTTDLGK